MSRDIYAVGDTVTLRDGLFRTGITGKVCRIVGILPSDHGEVQYRVRLGGETYERRIVASDIDCPKAAAPAGGTGGSPSASRLGEPWFKPSSIRIHK